MDIRQTRIAYDTVAAEYAGLLENNLAENPYDRAILGLFADLVLVSGAGQVVDLGCGPGRITAHLIALGVEAFGIDLSPTMVAVARQRYPGLRFAEGDITRLDIADGSLVGAAAWYSIIHTPPERLARLLGEFHRVLRPQGYLVLAFQVGDEQIRLTHAYGHEIELDAYRRSPDEVANLLETVGFGITARLTRAAIPPEKTTHAYLLAQKLT